MVWMYWPPISSLLIALLNPIVSEHTVIMDYSQFLRKHECSVPATLPGDVVMLWRYPLGAFPACRNMKAKNQRDHGLLLFLRPRCWVWDTCPSLLLSAQRHLPVPGGYRSHVPHWDSPMTCETQGSRNNLDFCKGHVVLSLSSDRVFDAGHPLGTCGSLCCRVPGSWVQILKLISFLTLLSRTLLFLKILITS